MGVKRRITREWEVKLFILGSRRVLVGTMNLGKLGTMNWGKRFFMLDSSRISVGNAAKHDLNPLVVALDLYYSHASRTPQTRPSPGRRLLSRTRAARGPFGRRQGRGRLTARRAG